MSTLRPVRTMWVATALAGLGYSALILRLHGTYGTQVFDLGIFDQGLWLLSRFEDPFVTLRGLHLFGDHSSYIMVLLAPLYWVWADVRVILIVVVAAMVAGAPLLFMAARSVGVRAPIAAAVSLAYLVHPAVAWNVNDNFHPEVLAVPLLMAAFVVAARGKAWWAAAFLLLTLLVKEDAALVVLPMALYLGFKFRHWKSVAAVALASVAIFLLNVWVVLPAFSPGGELIYSNRFGQFGDTPLQAAWFMITHPGEVLGTLLEGERIRYLTAMLLPLPLALFVPELLLVAVPITLANMLSLHVYQFDIKFHYTVYLLAIVGLAAATGARHLAKVDVRALAAATIVAGVAGAVLAGPLTRLWDVDIWVGRTQDAAAIDAALEVVPEDAVVSVDWFTGPHLSHRRQVYMYPIPFRPDVWSVPGEPLPPIEPIEYVVIQRWVRNPGWPTGLTYVDLLDDPAFEVVVENEEVTVFRRIESG